MFIILLCFGLYLSTPQIKSYIIWHEGCPWVIKWWTRIKKVIGQGHTAWKFLYFVSFLPISKHSMAKILPNLTIHFKRSNVKVTWPVGQRSRSFDLFKINHHVTAEGIPFPYDVIGRLWRLVTSQIRICIFSNWGDESFQHVRKCLEFSIDS